MTARSERLLRGLWRAALAVAAPVAQATWCLWLCGGLGTVWLALWVASRLV